jgi:hypothetical protein
METLGVEMFNGEECYKVKLIEKSGIESTEFYSLKTGLLAGSINKQETPFGAVTATSIVDEYKQVGELLIASKVTQKISGAAHVITMDEIEFDRLDDAPFATPKAIQNLADQQK